VSNLLLMLSRSLHWDSLLKDDHMDNVLQASSVTKIYRSGSNETTAVDDISLAVGKGEFVAIVGPSGSGKTTLLAVLAALLSPTNGEVYIDNIDLRKMNDSQRVKFRREKIGFTFQANNLLPFLTVQENVEMMLRLNSTFSRETKDYARDLLCRLGLEERLSYMPSQLSGGQRQRVSIARALVHNPSLVLADEPTASLDTERAYQVVKIFSDLIHEQNKAGIIVTHDLRMCIYVDRVIQMMDGKVENTLTTRQEIDDFMACG
jgi:putative ABC transport system ATP-binding protein